MLTPAERAECELIGRLCEMARAGETGRVYQLLAEYEEAQAERFTNYGLHDTAAFIKERAADIRAHIEGE